MGYDTEFWGSFSVTPPLNEHEIAYLKSFSMTRRMDREKGPYYVDGTGPFGQGADADVRNHNHPPEGQPGLWCQWIPTDDGTAIEWDGGEKFYYAAEWIIYIIEHFLTPDAVVAKLVTSDIPAERELLDTVFDYFGFFHVVNGTVDAQGEDSEDRYRIVIKNNKVTVPAPTLVWPDTEEEDDW